MACFDKFINSLERDFGPKGKGKEEIFVDTLYTRAFKKRNKKKAADDYMCNNFVWDKVTGIKEFIRDIHYEK